MADRFDVAERLAEGSPAVEHTETYVRACHALGYEHPDLTTHPSRLRDWYDSEEGLDLRSLDSDCAHLRAAGAAVMEAWRIQRAQIAELAAAWTGPGGDSAVRFLQRHCDAAYAVATEVRAAAQRCESLRDNLWYLVDSKVATAIAIDDRTRAQRPTWLAAAAAVTTGAGERTTAEEVVRQQITPYVDNEIRDDWLNAMRSTEAGVGTSFDMVTDRMAAAPAACFEVPDDLGPGYRPSPAPSVPTAAASVTPMYPGVPVDPAPAAVTAAPPTPAPAPPPVAPAPPPVAPAPAAFPASPLPELGTALGDAPSMAAGDSGGGAGGLGGLASRIVDAVGSLLGSVADEADPSNAADEDPFHDGDVANKADEPEKAPEKAPEVDKPDDKPKEGAPADEAQPVDTPAPATDAPAPAADAPPAQPPPAPIDAPAPVPKTPCEIAADQLPQAGG